MTAAALAAACVELLGDAGGTLAVVAPATPGLRAAVASRCAVADDAAGVAGAIVSFVGEAGDTPTRRSLLAALHARLPNGAPIVLADHNQPRRAVDRVVNAIDLRRRGLSPSRARYLAARELQDAGFAVERLRFGPGERVQLVRARRV